MMDLIERDKAIDALEREKTYASAFRDGYAKINVFEKYNRGLTDGIKAIKRLPSAQPEPQWIPCSERYPDMDERVLVYTVAHDYHVWDCMSNRADNYFWEDEEGLYHDKYEADLWMPLPEPWRGEES